MFSRSILLPFLIGLSRLAYGQFTYTQDQSIPVVVNGSSIYLPWSGGFNAVQFNTIDLDGDNNPDLVLFDRMADKLLTFLNNKDKTYRYAPEYETIFPSDVDQWLQLRDFNCDGKKDIFTFSIFGISVFVNTTQPGQRSQWREYGGNPLNTVGFNGNTNIQMNQTDVSGIQDVDGDGDLDILDAHFDGVGSLEWHKNMSIEKTGTCDSMQMVRITQKWGNFEECNCGQYLYGTESICPVFSGRIQHAAGKSILAIDIDNDGDKDLLFSEETCAQIYFMLNVGTRDSAVMTGFTTYPPTNPAVNFQIFPAGYYEDLDFDGVPDLMISSNIYDRSSIADNFQASAWLYKNTGTQQLPNFNFVKNNFLQDQMIDVGDNSTPAFFDIDGDGDLDMFIGSYTSGNIVSYLYYYENTGSANQPSFQLISNDFNAISQYGYYNLKPQFADIDGNGTIDLVFTATSAVSGSTTLYYIPNKSMDLLDISGTLPINTSFNIGPDENAVLVDINKDGLNDLLLGKSTGALQYWSNSGSRNSIPNYTLENGTFLGLGTTTDRQNPVAAAGDLDADGKLDLVFGNQKGVITIYSDFLGGNPSPTGVTDIIWDPFSQGYISKNLGGRVWPVVTNLFNTDRPAIALGNLMGGIQILKNDGSALLPPDPVISIYPNPIPQNKTFTIKSDRDVLAQIFSVLGQKISDEFLVPAYQNYPVTPAGLSPGVYIARFSVNGKFYAQRFIIF